MQVKELGHLVLYVRNLERSRGFYRDVLGWKEITVSGEEIGFPAAAFSSGRTHHELLLIEVGEDATPIPRGRRVGMYHFGLKIGETDAELREARDQLVAAGARLVGTADPVVLDISKLQTGVSDANAETQARLSPQHNPR